MLRRRALQLVLAAFCTLTAAAAAQATRGDEQIPALPPTAQLRHDQARFLRLASQGIDQARARWWNPKLGWYNELLYGNFDREPLLMLWSAFPLFEAIAFRARADRSPGNLAALRAFAAKAETYYDPALEPVGAYIYYPGKRSASITHYFDDNGWFGLAFLDAYDVTREKRWLRDAQLAFRFLDVSGWAASSGGGFWWDTKHRHKTSEPLAAAVVIAARLYGITHDRAYLRKAVRWLAWADANAWNRSRQLYQRSETDDIVMSYVEGMMAAANARLCRITGRSAYCAKADLVARKSVEAFSVELHWAPQYDAVYLNQLLDVYELTGNADWYALAYVNARRALANARDDAGLFQRGWGGELIDLGQEVHPGQLGLHAATVSLLARLAAAPVPAR